MNTAQNVEMVLDELFFFFTTLYISPPFYTKFTTCILICLVTQKQGFSVTGSAYSIAKTS